MQEDVRKSAAAHPAQARFKPVEELLLFRPLSEPLAAVFARLGWSPNATSVVSFVLTAVACALIAGWYPDGSWWARGSVALTLYVSFLFDKVDGDLARIRGKTSARGAYLDSFLDRVGEVGLLSSVAWATPVRPGWLLGLAMAGPLLFHVNTYMFWCYSGTWGSLFPSSGGRRRLLKSLVAYTRAKHFLLLIVLALAFRLEYCVYFFAFLVPYSVLVFLGLMARDWREPS